MPYRPSNLVRHSWSFPPRCLQSVKAQPLREDSAKSSQHDDFAHFSLACDCGAKTWSVVGYLPEPDLLLCPLTLKCLSCNKAAEIFDSEKHGYDAEVGNGCCSRRAEGKPVEFACPRCKGLSFLACAVFSYQMDESDLEEEDKSRVQDLFDTFGLQITCSACGRETGVCDYECA